MQDDQIYGKRLRYSLYAGGWNTAKQEGQSYAKN
jgi:hypothetical protein